MRLFTLQGRLDALRSLGLRPATTSDKDAFHVSNFQLLTLGHADKFGYANHLLNGIKSNEH